MKLSGIAKKMIYIIIGLLLLLIAASALYYRSLSFLPFAFGAILGCVLSVLRVILLESAVNKSLNMEKKAGANYIRLQYLIRFFLTALVLILAALTPFVSLWGAAGGIFSFQIATLCMKFFYQEDKNKNNKAAETPGK